MKSNKLYPIFFVLLVTSMIVTACSSTASATQIPCPGPDFGIYADAIKQIPADDGLLMTDTGLELIKADGGKYPEYVYAIPEKILITQDLEGKRLTVIIIHGGIQTWVENPENIITEINNKPITMGFQKCKKESITINYIAYQFNN